MEGAIKHVLGGKSKDDKKKGEGGGLSLFGGDKKKDQGRNEEGKGGFISNLLGKGDRNKGEKKSGFSGLFAEQEDEGAAGGSDEGLGGEGVCEFNEGKAGEFSGTGGGENEACLTFDCINKTLNIIL